MAQTLDFASASELAFASADEMVFDFGSVSLRTKFWRHPSDRDDLIVIVDDALGAGPEKPAEAFDGEALFGVAHASVLCLSDDWWDGEGVRQPGWGQGEFHQYALPTLHHVVEAARTRFELRGRIVVGGTGSGAFVALQLGSALRAASAVIANPVLDIGLTRSRTSNKMLQRAYPGFDLEEAQQRVPERLSVPKYLRRHRHMPDVDCVVSSATGRIVRRQVPLLLRAAADFGDVTPTPRMNIRVGGAATVGTDFLSNESTRRMIAAALTQEVSV